MQEQLKMPKNSFPKLVRVKDTRVILLVCKTPKGYHGVNLTGSAAGLPFGTLVQDEYNNLSKARYEIFPVGTKVILTQE